VFEPYFARDVRCLLLPRRRSSEFGWADRKEKGFNVIQIVAGLYPDMPPFDPRGANEAGYPWKTNYTGIRPEYFDAADQRLGYLVEQGFTPCIVGAWGYFIPWMGHGPSPNGAKDSVGYGKIPWDEAKNLAGSRQVALGKKLLAQYPWQHFTPHPEWAAFTNEAAVTLDGPHAAGIPATVRIIWVPVSKLIVVRNLGSQVRWAAAYFDPVNGARKELGAVRADETGLWRCDSPRATTTIGC